ncbi:MAG TPA: imidazolonepropionase [Candidatus Acidoferrales bacterium]|nr:imidazolonepropionase [Candidatus Acidoferrales bacterium]
MNESILITGCNELISLRGPVPRRGKALSDLGIIRNGAILVHDGKIAAIGPRNKIENDPRARTAEKIDLQGRVVLPGFVDSHTHLAFAASRADEHEQRIAGATYEQIAKAGGGILSSVRKLREISHDVLERGALANLRRFAEHGTTTIEAKSGYGLNAESELKTLKLYAALNAKQPIEIVPTFLGAHVVPLEYRKKQSGAAAYIEYLASELVPQIAAAGLSEYCDVFCDRGAFTVAQARKLLTAARACGMRLRIHAEQLARTGAARLAVELHAASADHLEKLNSADIRALGHSETVATLLPGCCFHLGEHQSAPARKLIEAGAIVALATDFNPGTSPTLSTPMVLSLATAQLRMTPAEAVSAATINAAYSLGRADRIGSLEVGKFADLAAFDVADYREIPYYFGVNLCVFTMKRGKVLHSRLHG